MPSLASPLPPVRLAQPQPLRYYRRDLLPLKPDRLWKIEAGIVRTVTRAEDGSLLALGIWGIGDVVGQALSSASFYQIECLTQVEVVSLTRDEWHIATDALIAQVQQLGELAVIRNHKRAEESLMRLLQWLAQKFGQASDQGHLLDLRLTHQDLSELLGLTRVTITRLLSQLEQQGLIQRLSRQRLIVQEGEFWFYEI